MSVNVKLNVAVPQASFPKLMINKDEIVVLFVNPEEGTVVRRKAGCCYTVGYHSTSWVPSAFADFHGSIELENAHD